MSNKSLILYDNQVKQNDQLNLRPHHGGQHDGKVVAYIHGTDIKLFEKWNKVIIPGSMFTAVKHFPGINPKVKFPSYNEALDLENTVALTDKEWKDSQVLLFAVGIGGCGPENSQVYEEDYTKWIQTKDLVPFRYQITDNDLSDEMRQKYFGRKVISANDRIAYYFKTFEQDPVLVQQYVDGTPIDENIYSSDNIMEAETYVELKLTILKEDCRDFFIATTGINDARINTISLLTAYPKIIDGFTYYQNIKPLTKLNFPNEALIDLTKGIDITYQIYY